MPTPTKTDLAARSFETVLRHLEHEDNKANRLIFSMAFLSAAAAAVFAAIEGDAGGNATIAAREVNIPVVLFGGFIGLVSVGTIFMLGALGPRFNWNPNQKGRNKWNDKSSLLFAEAIAGLDQSEWEKHWEDDSVETLNTRLEGNLVYETFLLARKASHKVSMMSIGGVLYRLAIFVLAWFLAISIVHDLALGIPFGGLAAAAVAFGIVYEGLAAPAGGSRTAFSGLFKRPETSVFNEWKKKSGSQKLIKLWEWPGLRRVQWSVLRWKPMLLLLSVILVGAGGIVSGLFVYLNW